MTADTESSMHAVRESVEIRRLKDRVEALERENAALRREVASKSTTALIRKPKP
jgi:hypothetical protein